jgi:hypothetical protein
VLRETVYHRFDRGLLSVWELRLERISIFGRISRDNMACPYS